MSKRRGGGRLHGMMPFPHHMQQAEMTCGVACLRMIQEWFEGQAESEGTWAARAGCNERGLTPTRLLRQLRKLAADRAVVREVPSSRWKSLPDRWTPVTVYVLLIDWFYAGERSRPGNSAHYLVAHRFTRGRRFGGGMVPVAVVQDPGDGPDPHFWSWPALLALETHRVFEVRRTEE